MISSGFKALFLYKRARECEGYERWDEAFYIEFFILIILMRLPLLDYPHNGNRRSGRKCVGHDGKCFVEHA